MFVIPLLAYTGRPIRLRQSPQQLNLCYNMPRKARTARKRDGLLRGAPMRAERLGSAPRVHPADVTSL